MAVAITFNYANWVAAFPQFSGVVEAQAAFWFEFAGYIFPNDETNPYYSTENNQLQFLLWLLTAHLLWLNMPRDNLGNPSSTGTQSAPGVVGRISSASEGSVAVAALPLRRHGNRTLARAADSTDDGNPSEAWYLQSPWGAQFWMLTSVRRMGVYYPHPTVVYGGGFPLISTYRGR